MTEPYDLVMFCVNSINNVDNCWGRYLFDWSSILQRALPTYHFKGRWNQVYDPMAKFTLEQPWRKYPMENSTSTQTEMVDVEMAHLHKLSASLKEMRQTQTLTDATLVCGEQRTQAHRVILSAISPYFYSALTKGWLETSSGLINLPITSALNLDTMLTFIYTGCLSDDVRNTETLMDILENSNYLLIDGLTQFSFQALASLQLTTSHFLEMFNYTEKLGNNDLVLQVANFLVLNFKDIGHAADFFLLKKSQMEKVLRSPALIHMSRAEILTGILRWTEVEVDRKDYLHGFMAIIFHHWCPECVSDLINLNASLKWNQQIRKLLQEYLEVINQSKAPAQYLLFFGSFKTRSTMTVYYVEKNQWSTTVQLPFYIDSGVNMAVYKHHVYFFGGGGNEDTPYPSTSVIKYCPSTNVVLANSSGGLIVPVYDAKVAVLNNCLYIVSGVDENCIAHETVQRYDPKDTTCDLVASTKIGHYSPAVLAFNNGLFVLGSDYIEQLVERYNPACDEWTVVTEIPGDFYDCVAALCDSKLFLILDWFDSKFHVYDINSDEWTVVVFHKCPIMVNWLWATRLQNRSALIVCGLENNANVVYKYDIESAQWTDRSSANIAEGDVSNYCCKMCI